ncbi:MAG TPA: SpoIIE family protein phosphatase [Terriglobales bacterium]|nr:SpoIIE family protein phosphatase [Terriglobales bacterium]HUL14965.1 SpoIIE family protein phosphatase [Terriglobales bacterium]
MPTIAPTCETQTLEQLREQEIAEARAIQEAMVPSGTLETAEVRIAHKFEPMEEVGGDFLDYFSLSDGSVGLYLGDVTGKGLPAALYAALAVGTLRGVHKTGTPPEAVLALLNKRLTLRSISARHAAIQYALLDPGSGILRISSAGMAGPLHLCGDGCRELLVRGIPPGIFAGTGYESETLQLKRGDSVIFVSDGLAEAMNAEEELFGMERLTEICGRMKGKGPDEILEILFEEVRQFSRGRRQRDDRTAAVLHYRR